MKRKSPETVFSINTRNRIKSLIDDYCNGKQIVFSERTGIPKGTVSHYVNGGNVPSDTYAEKIANAFKVSVLWIKGYDVPPHGTSNLRSLQTSADILDALSAHDDMIFANVFGSAAYYLFETEYKGKYMLVHRGTSEESIYISSHELKELNGNITDYAKFLLSKMFADGRTVYKADNDTLMAAHTNTDPHPSDGDSPEADWEKI